MKSCLIFNLAWNIFFFKETKIKSQSTKIDMSKINIDKSYHDDMIVKLTFKLTFNSNSLITVAIGYEKKNDLKNRIIPIKESRAPRRLLHISRRF